jgi:hypothetical protein
MLSLDYAFGLQSLDGGLIAWVGVAAAFVGGLGTLAVRRPVPQMAAKS